MTGSVRARCRGNGRNHSHSGHKRGDAEPLLAHGGQLSPDTASSQSCAASEGQLQTQRSIALPEPPAAGHTIRLHTGRLRAMSSAAMSLLACGSCGCKARRRSRRFFVCCSGPGAASPSNVTSPTGTNIKLNSVLKRCFWNQPEGPSGQQQELDPGSFGPQDLQSTSAETPPRRKHCVHQTLGNGLPGQVSPRGPCTPEDTSQTPPEDTNPLPKRSTTPRPQLSKQPPPPPPPRPKAKAGPPQREASSGPSIKEVPQLPQWQGPSPPPGLKAARIVNWQPIRQLQRWEGSVWQQILDRAQEGGFALLEEGPLTAAFMRQQAEDVEGRKETPRTPSKRRTLNRLLPTQGSLLVDLLHAQLGRLGIHEVQELRWVFGPVQVPEAPEPGEGGTEASGGELPEPVLEALLGLVTTAAEFEERLSRSLEQEGGELTAPADVFLKELISQMGPPRVLRARVELTLKLLRFPAEAAALSWELQLLLNAVQAVLRSEAVPKLLEGVLLLGNYVNASSRSLGGAVGVTLESLSKLAHTRCLPPPPTASQSAARGMPSPPVRRRDSHDNALLLLVAQLQARQSSISKILLADLEGCSKAKDLDPQVLATNVHELAGRIKTIEERLQFAAQARRDEPAALRPSRLRVFLQVAQPLVSELQGLLRELEKSTAELRSYFAEPPESSLQHMLRCLGALYEALPRPSPARPLPAFQKPVRLRRTGKRPTKRAQSLPSTKEKVAPSEKEKSMERRSSSWTAGCRHLPKDTGPLVVACSIPRVVQPTLQKSVITQPKPPATVHGRPKSACAKESEEQPAAEEPALRIRRQLPRIPSVPTNAPALKPSLAPLPAMPLHFALTATEMFPSEGDEATTAGATSDRQSIITVLVPDPLDSEDKLSSCPTETSSDFGDIPSPFSFGR